MGKRIYSEEQKEKRKQYCKRWRESHKEEVALYNRTYSEKYRDEHREELLEKKREYARTHKDEISKYMKEYNNTLIGRAANLASSYKQEDERYNRGECMITKEWIVDNIFSKCCMYCGETDWHKIGCDRIDNNLPHTPDNVVPCCGECNKKRGSMPYEEFVEKMLAEQSC